MHTALPAFAGGRRAEHGGVFTLRWASIFLISIAVPGSVSDDGTRFGRCRLRLFVGDSGGGGDCVSSIRLGILGALWGPMSSDFVRTSTRAVQRRLLLVECGAGGEWARIVGSLSGWIGCRGGIHS